MGKWPSNIKVKLEFRFLFMAADVSGDGSLDVKEFLSFSHPEEDPAMRPHVLAQVIFLAIPTTHILWSGLEGEGH